MKPGHHYARAPCPRNDRNRYLAISDGEKPAADFQAAGSADWPDFASPDGYHGKFVGNRRQGKTARKTARKNTRKNIGVKGPCRVGRSKKPSWALFGGDVLTAKSGASNSSFFFAASGGEWSRTKRFGETDCLFNFAPARGDCPCFRTSGICCRDETRPWCISHIYNRYGRISRIRKARGYYDSIHPKYFLYKGAWSLPNKLSEYTAPHYWPVSHDRTNCPIKIRIDLNPD